MPVLLKKIFSLFLLCACAQIACAASSEAGTAGERPGKGSASALSESAKLLEGGLSYFLRGDYSAARELFKNVSKKDAENFGVARYYIASMDAYDGEKDGAYANFLEAVKYAPKQIGALAALQYAKLADANGDYGLILQNLPPSAEAAGAPKLLDYYIAKARLADKSDARGKTDFYARLEREFEIADSAFADAYVFDRNSGDELFAGDGFSPQSPSSLAARARAKMLLSAKGAAGAPTGNTAGGLGGDSAGEKLGAEFASAGFLAKVRAAEDGSAKDLEGLKKALASDDRHAPFAWRAALALAREYFAAGDYEKAAEFSGEAVLLAPPDLRLSWPAVMLRGDALRMLKLYDAARECYLKVAMSKLLRGEPLAESLYKCGVCWYEQKVWGKAHPYFERVYIVFFKFEYWGARAYYYDASTLLMMGERRDAAAVLLEYFKRAKDKTSKIYLDARELYREQWGESRAYERARSRAGK